MANSYPKDDASQYESGEEWEIGLGNLIIDLDADLEKETMSTSSSTNNCLNDSSPFRIGKMKIKRKVSANTKPDGTAQDEPIESMSPTLADEKNTGTKSRKHEVVIIKTEKTESSPCENTIDEDKPKNKGGKDQDGDTESKEETTDKIEGKKKTKESSEKRPRKPKIDKQPSFEHVGIGTSEVGTLTEPDKLGPCEPGTSVNLEGIVWHETDEGVLVVNVTWRNKTYVGTLMDCTKHDWAPPRFCESPVNDIEGKAQSSKGRPKRNRNSTSVTDLSNYTETRSSIHCKLRNSTNGKGRRSLPIATVPNPEKTLNGKRKAKTSESELNSGDDKVVKKIKNSKTPSPVGSNESTSTSYTTSQVLIECMEPNCNKKYKHINGLRYHQAHAHHELPKKPQVPLDQPDSDDNFIDFTDMDTKELEAVDSKPTENDTQMDTENADVTSVKTDTVEEIDAAVNSDVVGKEKDNFENHLPKMVIDSGDEMRKEDIAETSSECNATENIMVKNSLSSTELPVDIDSQEKLSKSKNPDKDLSVFDFNSTAESDEQILEENCSEKTPVSVIKETVEANTAEKEINQPDVVKIEPHSVTSPVKPPVAICDQQKLKKVEKLKLQDKQKKIKPEKLLLKPKPNRPIAPAPQITPQLIAFPAVVTAPANAAATMSMPPVASKPQVTIMGTSTLKPIQPKPTSMCDQIVNPVLANLKEKKPKTKKRLKEKEVEKKANSPSIREPERKGLVGKGVIPIRPSGPSNIAHLKGAGPNPSELEPNILKQALTQSGINLDDYNSSSPSGSESNELRDANKDLTRTQPSHPPDTAAPSSTTTIPEPPKLIRTSSLPVKQQSNVTQPTQPKPLQQFEKNMAEKPVMSVLPAVKGTTVRPQEDLPPRVVIPQPPSASPEQNRATQSPAYSDISDANEEETAPRDRIVDVKDPFVFQEMAPMASHGHSHDGVLTEQRSFFPGYSGVIVRDRSHSPLSDVPSRPEMPKLIPKQRTEREVEVEEGPDSKNKDETSAKPSIYQRPQLYSPHRYPPYYLGYPHHMDPAANPLHMMANPPFGHPHERMENDQRDKEVAKNSDTKGQRNATHSRIENANVESAKSSKTEMNRTDKKIKSERKTDEVRDKQVKSHRHMSESIELKPQIRIRSPQESPRHYDRLLPQSYYMYPHPQWEESRRREIDDRRKMAKSKPDERKHQGQSSSSSPNPRVLEEKGKHRHTPESASSSSSMDSKTMRSNLPQDKQHEMEGPYSQYLQPSYMLPYSVVDDQYRQSVVAYQQYLPPEFGYPSVWRPDEKGNPANDPKRAKLMPGHSSTSPGKLTEILPDGKNALEVLKQHANQLMYPQNKEHIRGQDTNRTSPRKSASPAARKTPESSGIEELSRFEGSQHSPHPQMQHLHMHHHTHLGYPMMPYGQIITGNHPQAAASSLNPYTNTRE